MGEERDGDVTPESSRHHVLAAFLARVRLDVGGTKHQKDSRWVDEKLISNTMKKQRNTLGQQVPAQTYP